MLTGAERTVTAAVSDTLQALTLTDADTAAVRLAVLYAQAIDLRDRDSEILSELGPKLLAALSALGATPVARNRMKNAAAGTALPGRLAAVRAASG